MEKVKEKSSFFRKFVGDKRFYLMVLSIAVPSWYRTELQILSVFWTIS